MIFSTFAKRALLFFALTPLVATVAVAAEPTGPKPTIEEAVAILKAQSKYPHTISARNVAVVPYVQVPARWEDGVKVSEAVVVWKAVLCVGSCNVVEHDGGDGADHTAAESNDPGTPDPGPDPSPDPDPGPDPDPDPGPPGDNPGDET